MITIMSDVVFDALNGAAKRSVSLEPEQLLFNQADDVSVVYLLQSGALDLVRNQENGDRVILRQIKGRSIIAEASLYSPRYHCDCVCVQGAQVRALPVRRVRTIFRENPDLAELWAAYLATELQAMRHRCELLTRNTVAERLTGWLNWNGALPPKGQWRHLAGELGVTPEALYREISKQGLR